VPRQHPAAGRRLLNRQFELLSGNKAHDRS
jgi:hypothetical protein